MLDVLSGKASRDYACGIKIDEEFVTAVYELRAYFGFFKLARTCESILRFYSYDGATNYLKLKTAVDTEKCLVTGAKVIEMCT